MSIIFRKTTSKGSKKSLSPPLLAYITFIPGRQPYTAAFSLFSFVARNSTNSTSPRRRGPVQCRCSVGSERAPASHAWLARARAPLHRKERTSPSFSLSVSPLLCIHTSLSPPSFSLYPYLLSISLTCIYIYPLLRGSFSQRINLYVYNLTTVYFPRSFFQRVWLLSARSQASPRTRRTRKLSISSLTPCSCNPFLPPDFSDYVDFQSETHMYIFQRNCEKSVIERMEESNPGAFPRRSSIGRCTRPLDKLCSAHRLLIDCLHLVSLHWRPFVEIGSEKGGEENARWSVFSHAPSFQHFRRLPPRESAIAAIPIF